MAHRTPISSVETYKIARQQFTQVLSITEVQNSIMGKIVQGILKPAYTPIKVGNFIILGNKPEHDEIWKLGGQVASMSWFHKFVVPSEITDWRYFNAVSLPATSKTIDMLDEMEKVGIEYAAKYGVTKPFMFFHCYPNNSIPYLHLHIIDSEVVGPSFVKSAEYNLPLAVVKQTLMEETQF